jgi:hypothetical protein
VRAARDRRAGAKWIVKAHHYKESSEQIGKIVVKV